MYVSTVYVKEIYVTYDSIINRSAMMGSRRIFPQKKFAAHFLLSTHIFTPNNPQRFKTSRHDPLHAFCQDHLSQTSHRTRGSPC